MSEFQDIHRRDADSWAVKDEQAHGREVRSIHYFKSGRMFENAYREFF